MNKQRACSTEIPRLSFVIDFLPLMKNKDSIFFEIDNVYKVFTVPYFSIEITLIILRYYRKLINISILFDRIKIESFLKGFFWDKKNL